MSLIQQALEKTKRMQETRTTNPPSTSRTYERDPMGAALEQELIQVQQSYAKRRKLYWLVFLALLLVCLVTGLFYLGSRNKNVTPKKAESGGVPQVPVKIVSGYLYRLTGITNVSGKAIAVINNRLVGVGDVLNNRAVVMAIGEGEVRLGVEDKEIILTM
ncbi:MAG: hypothetical protein ABH891_04205 [Candidatus Omnitrophota bacterium]